MVLDYYKLREHPFGVTPDSRYLFLSPTHREALGSLLEICVASFGRCSPQRLREIRKLHPGLNDLDHIESGQTIHLPASGAITNQPDKASIAGRDKQ
jgi:hypothetical protein